MFDGLGQISWLGVAVATVASFLLGGVYFAVLVGRQYAAVLGREYRPQEKPAPLYLIGPLVCSLVTTVTSAVFMSALDVRSSLDALAFGALVGLGYFVATMTNVAINPNFPHPFRYAALNAPYFFLSSCVATFLLYLVP